MDIDDPMDAEGVEVAATVEAPIGKGDFARVFRARTPDGRRIACKQLVTNGYQSEREVAKMEAEILKCVSREHACVATYIGDESRASLFSESVWIWMEYADGGDLCTLSETQGRRSESVVWHYLGLLADALYHCHKLGVVHVDITLENVTVMEDKAHLRLVDFHQAGIVDSGDPAELKFTGKRGTPEYVRITGHVECADPPSSIMPGAAPATHRPARAVGRCLPR